MWERFAPSLARAVLDALVESAGRGLDAADESALLVTSLQSDDASTRTILQQLDVDVTTVVEQICKNAERGKGRRQRASHLTGDAFRLLERADALTTGDRFVEPVHVLAAALELGVPGTTPLVEAGLDAHVLTERHVPTERPRRRPPLSQFVRRLTRPARVFHGIFFEKSLAHPRFVSNPYPLYAWLREHRPVRPDPLGPVWILSRFDDVERLLRDPRLAKDPFERERIPRAMREQFDLSATIARTEVETVSMLFLDPPEHTRVRARFTRAFSAGRIKALVPRVETICRELLDGVATTERFDLIGTIGYPLPIRVIAELVGFPPEDFERIKHWSDALAGTISLRPSDSAREQADRAMNELRDYFDRLVDARERSRDQPDDLLAALLADASEPGALTREEVFINSVLLLAAGHETTTNLIGNGVLALLRHPEQMRLLRDDPSLMATAIEELLRYDSPVQWSSRVTREPTEFSGVVVPADQIVLGSIGSANRDPAAFDDPDTLDLRRTPNKHLAFGAGAHYCLGATLARIEMRAVLEAMLMRFRSVELVRTHLPRQGGMTFRGVKQLPIRVTR